MCRTRRRRRPDRSMTRPTPWPMPRPGTRYWTVRAAGWRRPRPPGPRAGRTGTTGRVRRRRPRPAAAPRGRRGSSGDWSRPAVAAAGSASLTLLDRGRQRASGSSKAFRGSRYLQPDVEGRRVAAPRLAGQAEQQLVAATLVDPVAGVAQRALALLGVWLPGVDLVNDAIVEEQLRGELQAAAGRGVRPDLEMDMDGSALVPTGHDRGELRYPARVRD